MNTDDRNIRNKPISVLPLHSDDGSADDAAGPRHHADDDGGHPIKEDTRTRRPSITGEFCGGGGECPAGPAPARRERASRRRSSGVSFEVHPSLVLGELKDLIDREDAAEETAEEEEMRLRANKKNNKTGSKGDGGHEDDEDDSLDGIPTAARIAQARRQAQQQRHPSMHDSGISLESVLEDESIPVLRKIEARIVDREVRAGRNVGMFERSRSWGEMALSSSSSSQRRLLFTSPSDAVLRGGRGRGMMSGTRMMPTDNSERRNATFADEDGAGAVTTEESSPNGQKQERRRSSRRMSTENPFLAGGDFMGLLRH